jgi:sugar phosphate isomerase/epimerase
MPDLAVSNIALSAFDHGAEIDRLGDFGLIGLEVAPSRVWRDTWHGLAATDVDRYRRRIEAAGLRGIGLHSLFFDHPGLGLFKEPEVRAETQDFLVHLSAMCRDLGGRTLIYGGGRKRGAVGVEAAFAETVDFFGELCQRIEGHGTCFCLEPLSPRETDFIHSVFDALAVVKAVNHVALRMQLDAKALVANGEATAEPFRAAAADLVHFHANEPGLAVLGTSGTVDHAAFGQFLRDVGYRGFVSVEQRHLNPEDPIGDIAKSVAVLKRCYLQEADGNQ